ncbi:MAG: GNAT family N-acetyltransferase [Acidiferrobacterales bacterium]|nr:GNAT family N-acetyltransferase [Acidiferrobacterales bacterium]
MNNPNKPLIVTERLKIYLLTLEDASFVLELTNTLGWIRYIGRRNLADVAAAEEYLKNGFLEIQKEQGYGYYLVKSKSGESMGIVGFLKKNELEYEDFGFAFLPEWQGQGYAYEASVATLDFGVKEFGFTVLDAVTLANNMPSQKLLLKLGFKNMGWLVNDNKEEMLFRLQT